MPLARALAYNSLRKVYEPTQEVLAEVLAPELRANWLYQTIAEAMERGAVDDAALAAQTLVRKGLDAVLAAIAVYDAQLTQAEQTGC